MSYTPAMANQVRFKPAMLLFAVLMSAAPGAQAEARSPRDPQRARELDRLQALVGPLVKPVLEAQDPLELEAALEDQLFSGVLADILGVSLTTLLQDQPVTPDQVEACFEASIGQLDVDRERMARAVDLTMASNLIVREILAALDEDERAGLIGEQGQAPQLDIQDMLYDAEVPVEVREAFHGELESAICMICLVSAAEFAPDTPRWMLEELLNRWSAGLEKSLPLSWALLTSHAEASGELTVALDKLVDEGMSPVVLEDIRERSLQFNEALQEIADQAARQPDGQWPPE